jgi:hypothetical protein
MRVNPSHAGEPVQQAATARAAKAPAGSNPFATALAKASATTQASAGLGTRQPVATAATESSASTKTRFPGAPKGEQYAEVEGRKDCVEVVAGPRNGMFINTSGNGRDGEAFLLVRRGDRELHIYGTGRNREVVTVRDEQPRAGKPADGGTTGKDKADTADKAAEKPAVPKSERYLDVAGHTDYDEIVKGPRNGMFLNTSGNARDGRAFILVERGDHELHIYGTARNRLTIRVPEADKPAQDASSGTTTTGTGNPVGGGVPTV